LKKTETSFSLLPCARTDFDVTTGRLQNRCYFQGVTVRVSYVLTHRKLYKNNGQRCSSTLFDFATSPEWRQNRSGLCTWY